MTRIYWGIAIGITLIALVATAVIYPTLPAKVPIHWNIRGEVDSYGPKTWAAFLMPGAMLVMLGVFAVLPMLSPKHFEIDSFRTTYLFIVVLVTGLFGYIHALSMLGSMSRALDFPRAMCGGLYLFFMLMGNVLGKVRRNFYVGIRVPWTLANDRVWNETHRLGAWLMMAAGAIGMLFVVLNLPFYLGFIPLGIAVIVPIVHSFLLYKRLERNGQLDG
jgi:uncharacterized membrane protein